MNSIRKVIGEDINVAEPGCRERELVMASPKRIVDMVEGDMKVLFL